MSEAITADIPLKPVLGLKPVPLTPEPPAPSTTDALTPPPPPEPPGLLTKLFAVFGVTLTRRQAGVAAAALGSLLLGIVGVKLLMPNKPAAATQPLAATTPEPPKPAPTTAPTYPGVLPPPVLPAPAAPPVGGSAPPSIPVAGPTPPPAAYPPPSDVSSLPPPTLTAERKPDPLMVPPPATVSPVAPTADLSHGAAAASKPDPLAVPPAPPAAVDKWTRPSDAVTPAGGVPPIGPVSPGGPPTLPGVQPNDLTPAAATFPAPLPVVPKSPAPGGPVTPPADPTSLVPPIGIPPAPASVVPPIGGPPTSVVPPIGGPPATPAVPPVVAETPVVPPLPVPLSGGVTPPVGGAPPQPKPLIPESPAFTPTPPAGAVPPAAPPLTTPPEPAALPKTIDPPAARHDFTKTAGAVETRPLAVNQSAPATTFDVDLHTAKASDTYDSISREFYNDGKYAVALKLYNGGRSLANSSTVEVPPIHVLKKRHPGSIPAGTAATPAGSPNWGTSSPTPVTPTGNTRPPEFRASKAGTYTVPATGATFRQIARLTLGNEQRWGDLWDMNRQYRADDVLPAGTVVKLPSDAKFTD